MILKGLKVVDLSRLLPGPYCSMILADLGAEVLKVEEPLSGDYMRLFPPLLDGESLYYLPINRGKKSISLNLKTAKGKEILRKIVADTDVLIESFRPGVMKKLNLDYEELKKNNNKLIYCAITGFGKNSPLKDLGGHDLNYIAYAGILSQTIGVDGKAAIPGIQIADIAGGAMTAAISILSAYINCLKTGNGKYLDVSMADGSAALMTTYYTVASFLKNETYFKKDWLTGLYPYYNIYETSDGKYVTFGAIEEKFFKNFCKAVGREELIPVQNDGDKKEYLFKVLTEIFKSKSHKEWLDFSSKVDACVAPVLAPEELTEIEHFNKCGFVHEMKTGHGSGFGYFSFPVKFSGEVFFNSNPSPKLGENSYEVLEKMGYTKEEIDNFKKEGVI